MKAIVQDRYGRADVLALREVDPPVPAAGEVRVSVRAAAVNAADWHIMRGDPYVARLTIGLGRPRARIRGRDFAGVVDAVGAGVTRLRVGDEVYGETGLSDGAFAEYVCVREDLVEAKPANLTFEQAAAVPLAGVTALTGLRDVVAGQHVLVNGASGGVGTFAVQIAKAAGASVTGVCSARNAELVRSLGATQVIDYRLDDFTRHGPYDVVFDLVGNRSLGALRGAAGTVVLSGGGVSGDGSLFGPMGLILRSKVASPFVRQRLVVLTVRTGRAELAELRELIEAGSVTPMIDRTYSLADAPEAIRYVEEEHARAKVVITVAG